MDINELIRQLPSILTGIAAVIAAVYGIRAHSQSVANAVVTQNTNDIIKEAHPEQAAIVNMRPPAF